LQISALEIQCEEAQLTCGQHMLCSLKQPGDDLLLLSTDVLLEIALYQVFHILFKCALFPSLISEMIAQCRLQHPIKVGFRSIDDIPVLPDFGKHTVDQFIRLSFRGLKGFANLSPASQPLLGIKRFEGKFRLGRNGCACAMWKQRVVHLSPIVTPPVSLLL
jgi:hypothetical protein